MRIAVLLSGGVDSSTALARLVEDGYRNITAYYLKIWLEDEMRRLGSCPWEEDLEYARAVCRRFDVPLQVVPLQREYYDTVVRYAVDELAAGRTPSPDIFCNRRIKFGAFLERIGYESVDRVASGHYARLEHRYDGTRLLRAPDPVKDQTYFLSHLTQQQLRRALFPIGEFQKREVRLLAERYDLPNKARKDSQGICFLGNISYPEFVRYYLGERDGAIVERESGKELGRHRGFWFYTVGQRQGLGLSGGPWYVVDKIPSENTVVVSHRAEATAQARDRFHVVDLHWVCDTPADEQLSLKLRHGPQQIPCRIRPLQDVSRGDGGARGGRGASGDGGARGGVPAGGVSTAAESALEVTIERPDRGVAPGQFAVFYHGEHCLGAGRIVVPPEVPLPERERGAERERAGAKGSSEPAVRNDARVGG